MAVECLVARDLVVIAGKINTGVNHMHDNNMARIHALVRQVLRGVGYDSTFPGIDPDECESRVHITRQSADIILIYFESSTLEKIFPSAHSFRHIVFFHVQPIGMLSIKDPHSSHVLNLQSFC